MDKKSIIYPPVWVDPFRGKRGHSLMTAAVARKIPPIGATGELKRDEITVHAKLFSPYTGWVWYIIEMEPNIGLCFMEMGNFYLSELCSVSAYGAPAIERDLYWQSRPLGEVMANPYGK